MATTSGGSGGSESRIPGSWWYWYYKDAIKVGQTIPAFEAMGKKKFFGLSRSQMSSPLLFQQLKFPVASCIVFFPRADYTVDQFASQLKSSFKTAITMGKHAANIHIFVTCSSVEEFDKRTERSPSGVNLWADVNGEIAEKFGMRPLLQVVDVADILSFDDKADVTRENRRYEKQTQTGMFMLIKDRITKSPAFQPKLQTANIGTMKTAFEAIETAAYNYDRSVASDSYAVDLTEKELRTRHSKAWTVYEEEHGQMMEDMHGGDKAKKKKVKTRRKKIAGMPAKKKAGSDAQSTRTKTSQGDKSVKIRAYGRTKSKPRAKSASKTDRPDGFIRSKL